MGASFPPGPAPYRSAASNDGPDAPAVSNGMLQPHHHQEQNYAEALAELISFD